MTKSQSLCRFISEQTDLLQRKDSFAQKTYNHMGATIVDSVLQAGLNYYTIVFPRVEHLILTYPYYRTTSDFLILINSMPLRDIIHFDNTAKSWSIFCLAWFLNNHGIQTEKEAAVWLKSESNTQCLLGIKGIGNKTIDYLKGLVGIRESIAIDRHLFGLLKLAGIEYNDYKEAHDIYSQAAYLLDCDPYCLDKSVWNYMTKRVPEYV